MHPLAVQSHLRPRFAYILDHYGHARSRKRASARRGESPLYNTRYHNIMAAPTPPGQGFVQSIAALHPLSLVDCPVALSSNSSSSSSTSTSSTAAARYLA